MSLSSPPVAGVWWAHWRRCPVAAVTSHWWWLRRAPPHMIVKCFGCTAIHNKALCKCIIHSSFIHRVSKRAGKITLDPSHPAHSSLNRYRLVDATELWAPERPDTETVSFLRQSISWTLDIKRGTHNTIIQLFIHHSNIFFISNLHMSDLTHNCLYYILCFCYFVHICILFFYYLCLVLLLSFCCTVELLSL